MDPTHPTKQSKIIFLDVDGVLNSAFDVDPNEEIVPKHVKILKQIVDETGAEIVVHSSWKYAPEMLEKLSCALAEFDLCIRDIAPNILKGEIGREYEILQWLREHFSNPEKECNYVVLDDWDLSSHFGHRMIQTWEPERRAFGLDEVFAKRACEILNKTP